MGLFIRAVLYRYIITIIVISSSNSIFGYRKLFFIIIISNILVSVNWVFVESRDLEMGRFLGKKSVIKL